VAARRHHLAAVLRSCRIQVRESLGKLSRIDKIRALMLGRSSAGQILGSSALPDGGSRQPLRARVRAAFLAEADRALFGRAADAAPPSRPPLRAGSLLTA